MVRIQFFDHCVWLIDTLTHQGADKGAENLSSQQTTHTHTHTQYIG